MRRAAVVVVPHTNQTKDSFCCLFLLFTLLILISLAIFLVFLKVAKPQMPLVYLHEVNVQYIAITYNGSTDAAAATTALSLQIRLVFEATNPNKIGVEYAESRLVVNYREVVIGEGTVPAFDQPAHSVSYFETYFAVDRVNLQHKDAIDLFADTTRVDHVDVRVHGDFRAKLQILNFDYSVQPNASPKPKEGKVMELVKSIILLKKRFQSCHSSSSSVDFRKNAEAVLEFARASIILEQTTVKQVEEIVLIKKEQCDLLGGH